MLDLTPSLQYTAIAALSLLVGFRHRSILTRPIHSAEDRQGSLCSTSAQGAIVSGRDRGDDPEATRIADPDAEDVAVGHAGGRRCGRCCGDGWHR
eukprot:6262479-Prymnesium_polylepis.1